MPKWCSPDATRASAWWTQPSAADRAAARAALAFFGMNGYALRPLAELSYGQMRRVLFARAWAGKPPLLLLDEPYSGVDAPTRHALVRHLDELIAAGTTVVIATHNREEWPAGTTHELALAKGSPVWCGPVRPRHSRSTARTAKSR